MNLRQIEVFRAVMVAGSITDAARALHVSQPGISRLVRHLELRLRVTLFERRKGRLLPTPEALALHAEIERAYRGVMHVQEFAAGLHLGRRTTLRVLSSANTALQLVPRAIASIVERHPESKLYFETLPAREIVKLLLAEEADIAVSSAPLDHPSFEVREIGQWSLVCALPQGHRIAKSKVLPLEEVLRERLVVYSPEAPQSDAIRTARRAACMSRRLAAVSSRACREAEGIARWSELCSFVEEQGLERRCIAGHQPWASPAAPAA